jgi:hypothetical protein
MRQFATTLRIWEDIMNSKLIAAFAIAMAATFSFAIGSPAKAQERSNVYAPINCDFGAIPCKDVGESRLLRTDDGVSVNIVTTKLRKGHAYTVWWIVFNDPSACVGGCGEDDLGRLAVNATVIWATGDVPAQSGIGIGKKTADDFTAHLNEDELPKGGGFGFPGDDDGLVDAKLAEIHMVVRSHGPAIKRKVNAQITSFDGGCKGPDVAPKIPKKKGECADVQFAVHAPPAP